MKISVVTDEISADLETALELAVRWRVDAVEIRGVGTERYPSVSDYWLTRAPQLVAEAGLPVAAISPGLFKIPLPAPPPGNARDLRWNDAAHFARAGRQQATVDRHLDELLPAAIEAAQRLGTDQVICFGFERGAGVPRGPAPAAAADVLGQAAEHAHREGVRLLVETEDVCWADNGEHTAALVRAVDHPALAVNYDPTNTFCSGDTRPHVTSYPPLAGLIAHVHFKDAAVDARSGAPTFTTDGDVEWPPILAALRRDGYVGYVSVETHARPKIAATEYMLGRLRTLLDGLAS
jgi:sugar phosphate isomerase/epimerase